MVTLCDVTYWILRNLYDVTLRTRFVVTFRCNIRLVVTTREGFVLTPGDGRGPYRFDVSSDSKTLCSLPWTLLDFTLLLSLIPGGGGPLRAGFTAILGC